MNKFIPIGAFLGGVVVGIFLSKKVIKVNSTSYIEKGQCSKDVEKLQKTVNYLLGNNVIADDKMGCYDKETVNLVNQVFAGTSALYDDKGTISKEFIENIYLTIN